MNQSDPGKEKDVLSSGFKTKAQPKKLSLDVPNGFNIKNINSVQDQLDKLSITSLEDSPEKPKQRSATVSSMKNITYASTPTKPPRNDNSFEARSNSDSKANKEDNKQVENSSTSTWREEECKDLLEGKSAIDLRPSNLTAVKWLGRGSQGHVELMKHNLEDKMIALKYMNFNADENFLKNLKIELNTLRSCDSQYIVQCYGTIYQKGQIGIYLEYMDKGTLGDILKAIGPLDEYILGYITYQCLKGLEYLHKVKRVIHRDIKPSNLLVNSQGQVKISDFGVSAVIDFTLQEKKTWVGTLNYMSPERLQGQKYLFDTDLWSLGLTIAECALGRYPYPEEETSSEVKQKPMGYFDLMEYVLQNPYPKLPAKCSNEIKDFVSICLRKEAGTRSTASDLLKHPFVRNYANISTKIFSKWLEDI